MLVAHCWQLIMNIVNYLDYVINAYQQQHICLLFNTDPTNNRCNQRCRVGVFTRCLRVFITISEIWNKDNSISILHKIIHALAIEKYKVGNGSFIWYVSEFFWKSNIS